MPAGNIALRAQLLARGIVTAIAGDPSGQCWAKCGDFDERGRLTARRGPFIIGLTFNDHWC
jgi:hypothetical protein